MQYVIGLATEVTHGFDWAGEGGGFSHTTKFMLGTQRVSLDTSSRTSVENGQRIAVAGWLRQDTMKALAYRNLSTGSYGDSGYASALLVGLVLTLVGCTLLLFAPIFGLFIAAAGGWLLSEACRIEAAIRALESAA